VANLEIAVYSKTGAVLLSPRPTSTLWAGFGGGCEKNNNGDATALFDTISQRWIVQQFSVSTTPYLDCVAVSETSDATGKWYRYSFQRSKFPDYPKMGVWPDAYYASFNLYNAAQTVFEGAEECAFNRAAMLIGAAATQQCFTGTKTNGFSLLPATLDGSTPPPAGTPEWFVALSPTTTNALAYWKFHVDWTTPANTTVTGPTNLPVTAFSQACGGDNSCVPQAETTQQLDSLGDRLMYRLAYRNFGDHEALVVSHSVTAGSSVGMRWYELRPSGGALAVFQQGTYAPDSAWRWMGSIAMDKSNDMGLGYSASSSTLHPQIRYTGRLAGDPLNAMPQGEATLLSGAGSQTGGSRWGDYTEMSIDPADGCTFWYVNEYIPATGANWHTRIGSFKFPSCGVPSATTEAASSVTSAGAILNGTVNPHGVETTYHFEYGPTTSYGTSVPVPNGGVGSGTANVKKSNAITGLAKETTYHYRIVATSGTTTVFGEDRAFTTLGQPWTIHSTPNPSESFNRLWAVSCTSSTECTAVGYAVVGGSTVSLAESWNGSAWTVQKTPNPAGAPVSELYGVSCTSATACTAAGRYLNSESSLRPFALRWNGSVWSLENVPIPTGAKSGSLNAVTCTSASACTAVGQYDNAAGVSVPLASVWNGTAWANQAVPSPSGSEGNSLAGIACSAASACTAIGTYATGIGVYHLLGLRWNGTTWALQTIPSPAEATLQFLTGVSCPATNTCMAVGYYGGEFGYRTLAESWNGSSWTIRPTPSPAKESALWSISCTGVATCTALGQQGPEFFSSTPLAENWNGTEWELRTMETPVGAKTVELLGTSCVLSFCAGVGSYSNSASHYLTLAESHG
jgi:hypothetical protein